MEKKLLRIRKVLGTRTCSDMVNYDPNYANMLVEHRAGGKSITSFAAHLCVSINILKRWAKESEDFKLAMEVADTMAMAAWEDIAMEQAQGVHKGNASTLMFMLKNQFGDEYKDKQEVEHSGNVVFKIDTGIKRDIELIEDNGPEVIEAELVEKDEDLL